VNPVPGGAWPSHRRYRADPADWFTSAEIARATRYRGPLRRAARIEAIAGAAALVAAVVLRLATRLTRALGASGRPAALAIAGGLILGATLIDLPFSAWRLAYERRWGFSRQTAGGWVADHGKGLAISLVLGGAVVLGGWSVVDATGWWWLWLWVAGSLLPALLVMVAPAVLAPLFNRFRELDDPELVAATQDLGRRLGVRIRQVLVMDASRRTAKHNAYFTGLGRTKRVVLWDTLIADYDRPATLAVLAHELGHWRRHHVRWLLAVTSAVLLPGLLALRLLLDAAGTHRWFGVAGAADPAAIPLAVLAVVAAQAAWLPVAGWISRAFERQADADAVALIADPQPFVAMMRELAVKNLSDLSPSRWAAVLGSHPPAAERMALALATAGMRADAQAALKATETP